MYPRSYGQINFVGCFVPKFSYIIKPIDFLLQNDTQFCWNNRAHKDFQAIKDAISATPMLSKPDFCRNFTIYTNSNDQVLLTILMQLDSHGYDRTMA